MKKNELVVFILSHGRAGNLVTLNMIRSHGYTGDYKIVLDNEDESIHEYEKKFGKDNIVVFDKLAISKTFDTADNFDNRKTIVYARNACFGLARKLGYKYFMELDDDYNEMSFRYAEGGKLVQKRITDMDEVLRYMVDFLENGNLDTIAMAQGGDFIGGVDGGNFRKGLLRKAMNTFIFRTDSKMRFIGRINEDVNLYTHLGSLGAKIFTITDIMINQAQTQKNAGGMTDVYLDNGTYLKSFYTVMFQPSSVWVSQMGSTHSRLHHHVSWNNTVPKVINQDWKRD